jgi:hypothetical protein
MAQKDLGRKLINSELLETIADVVSINYIAPEVGVQKISGMIS